MIPGALSLTTIHEVGHIVGVADQVDDLTDQNTSDTLFGPPTCRSSIGYAPTLRIEWRHALLNCECGIAYQRGHAPTYARTTSAQHTRERGFVTLQSYCHSRSYRGIGCFCSVDFEQLLEI
jgi:hypothetical protein